MQYWLMKSEPTTYGIDQLMQCPKQTDTWDGIRNYQARNFMRHQMTPGDLAFFYHSSCQVPAIVGTMKIVSTAYPDSTALDPNSPYYDPKATIDNPRWFMVDVQLQTKFTQPITLQTLRQDTRLQSMLLLQRGCRLSIQPVLPEHWQIILEYNCS